MKKNASILGLLMILVFLAGLTGCTSEEPKVEWHSQFFSALGDDYYYEGTLHNGGRGTAKEVEIELLLPEDLVQRKQSEVNPIRLGEIGPENISKYTGRIQFDFANLSKSEIMDLISDLEIKVRWKEDGTAREDFLRRKEDIVNGQAQ